MNVIWRKATAVGVLWLAWHLPVELPIGGLGDRVARAAADETAAAWDIEAAPGEHFSQAIDVTEGTWINLDVSPDGQEVVFDLLGDIYAMPITGADGQDDHYPYKLTAGVAWDMQPRFSPDGQTIAFTSDRKGQSERAGDNIWTMARDGSKLTQVTNETFRLLNGPNWSPDGNYLVARKHFSSRRSLGAGEVWMFHRAALDSDAMTGLQLTKRSNDQKDVNEPIFSRDGNYLFYSQDATPGDTFEYDKDSNKQIYVIKRLDLASGETESFVTGPGGACRPTPSPDGSQLAFVRRVGAQTGLHLMDLESGQIRLIYDQLERDMQEAWAIHGVYPAFAWLPDGKSIVVWAKGQIRRIRIDDGTAEIIPFHIRDTRQMTRALRTPIAVAPEQFPVKMLRWMQMSPAGNQVAFQALGYLYVRDLPDGEPRRVTSQEDHFEFYPSYSPDGRYLVYTTWNDEKLGTVRVASTAAGDAENWIVTTRPGHYLEPVFSPDQESIIYVKSSGGYLTSPLWSRDTGLYRVPARGGDSQRIAESGSHPQFADSSDRVYFIESRADKEADNTILCSIELSGLRKREHYKSQWGTDYRVSPDGRWLAFIERFHVHLSPLVRTGNTIDIGPGSTALPTVRVSREAGDWIHFSGDAQQLHWGLGSKLYSVSLADALAFLGSGADASRTSSTPADSRQDHPEGEAAPQLVPEERELGFLRPYAKPETTIALVGGRLVTMGPAGIIPNGTVVVQGNRILAVGEKSEVVIPADATIVPIPGLVVLPGYVDTHAHGPMASEGITPQASWVNYARLSFGVTTIHDPSNDTHSIFAASEMAKAGTIVAPRTFSTGTILYGAAGANKAEIDSLDDAKFHLRRMQAVGAFTVKSYNQPRRDQRQQVLAAARESGMMVVPEGGSTFMHNMTMIVDGHTGIEHTLPVQTAYDDVMDLWRGTQVGYTPTLCVAYGGISGERYWYAVDDLWQHPKLVRFLPPHVLQPRSRRREKAPLEDYNHIKVAEIAKQVVRDGGLVQAGGHGQLNGICTHWELWSFVQGGMTPLEALQCGTLNGAKYLGLDGDLGSLQVGKLADLQVIERGYDPTKEIRDTQQVALVMVNGRLFDANSMAEVAGVEAAAPKFYFAHANDVQSLGTPLPRLPGCQCCRPGSTASWWTDGP